MKETFVLVVSLVLSLLRVQCGVAQTTVLPPHVDVGADADPNNAHLKLTMSEKKLPNGQIVFSLQSVRPLYGDFSGSYESISNGESDKKDNYILESYNSAGKDSKLCGRFWVRSSRFAIMETADGKYSRVVEYASGVIETVIPFDIKNPAATIAIKNGNEKTEFPPLPAGELVKQFQKILASVVSPEKE